MASPSRSLDDEGEPIPGVPDDRLVAEAGLSRRWETSRSIDFGWIWTTSTTSPCAWSSTSS